MFGTAPKPAFSFGSSSNQGSTGIGNTSSPAGGLFGSKPTSSSTPASGGLFGQNNSNQSTNTGGLFGQTNANNSLGGLFGQKPATSVSTPTSFGSLNTTNTGGGLFGAKPAEGSSNSNTSTSGGLFGSSGTNTILNPVQLGGLFGSNAPANSTGSGSLFNLNNARKPGGLFGNTSNTGSAGGLFGNSSNQGNQSGSGLFKGANTGGLFGSQTQQQQPHQPHQQLLLLQQAQLSGMTRVGDLPPDVKRELEEFDRYINLQHLVATTLNTDRQKHNELIKSIPNDVDYLHSKVFLIKQALHHDTNQLKALKTVNEDLTNDINNIMHLIIQLSTPGTKLSSSFHLNEFFVKKIKQYKDILSTYEDVIKEADEAVAGLEKYSNDTIGGMHSIVEVVKNQYALFMELCETLAQVHNECRRLST